MYMVHKTYETDRTLWLAHYIYINNDDDNSIQFNSIYYLRAESTATRTITDTAQRRYNNNNSQTIMIIRIIIIVGQNNLLI
jgi:hypothetical protein